MTPLCNPRDKPPAGRQAALRAAAAVVAHGGRVAAAALLATVHGVAALAAEPARAPRRPGRRRPAGAPGGAVAPGRTLAGARHRACRRAAGQRRRARRVLLSDDGGKSWRQSGGVPVSVTLTAVAFADPRNGWATGHAGVVLHTADAGDNWTLQLDGRRAARLALQAASARPADEPALRAARQLVADGPDKPFLALQFSSASRGIVVGALRPRLSHRRTAAASWTPRLADVDNPGGLHLNAVRSVGGATYIAGEKGLLLKADGGARFTALASPYDGSWFALDAVAGGAIVVAGLRGNAYASEDAGASWQKLDVPSGVTLSQATKTADGRLLFVDQAGSPLALTGRRPGGEGARHRRRRRRSLKGCTP